MQCLVEDGVQHQTKQHNVFLPPVEADCAACFPAFLAAGLASLDLTGTFSCFGICSSLQTSQVRHNFASDT